MTWTHLLGLDLDLPPPVDLAFLLRLSTWLVLTQIWPSVNFDSDPTPYWTWSWLGLCPLLGFVLTQSHLPVLDLDLARLVLILTQTQLSVGLDFDSDSTFCWSWFWPSVSFDPDSDSLPCRSWSWFELNHLLVLYSPLFFLILVLTLTDPTNSLGIESYSPHYDSDLSSCWSKLVPWKTEQSLIITNFCLIHHYPLLLDTFSVIIHHIAIIFTCLWTSHFWLGHHADMRRRLGISLIIRNFIILSQVSFSLFSLFLPSVPGITEQKLFMTWKQWLI